MKNGMVADRIRKILGGLKFEFLADIGKNPSKLGRLDSAVLKVAMMISALDGHVTDDELKAFERMAKTLRGYSAADAKRVFKEGLRSAGYIELVARTLTTKDLVEIFIDEAEALIPNGFVFGNAQEIRKAFVMWMTMAMADEDFSPVERKAIREFAEIVSLRVETIQQSNITLHRGFAPSFAMAYASDRDIPGGTVLSSAFFKAAEELISRLGKGSASLTAAKELKQLVEKGCPQPR